MCTVTCNLEALKGLSVGDINLPYFSTFLCYFISVHLSQKVKKKNEEVILNGNLINGNTQIVALLTRL